jgi:hypothetical protein
MVPRMGAKRRIPFDGNSLSDKSPQVAREERACCPGIGRIDLNFIEAFLRIERSRWRKSVRPRSGSPRYSVQQLLSDPHDVLLSIGSLRSRLLVHASPINVLEVCLAFVKTKGRARRLVDDLVFPNLELIGHNRHCHVFSSLERAQPSTWAPAHRRGQAFRQSANSLQCSLHCKDIAVRAKARHHAFAPGYANARLLCTVIRYAGSCME